MVQKIIKVGSSIALVVPKAVAEEMGVQAGDTMALTTDIKRGVISYTKKSEKSKKGREAQIADLTLNFIDRYRKDLEALKDK